MKNTYCYLLTFIATILLFSCSSAKKGESEITDYPKTKKIDTVADRYFGIEVKDPYRWLEDDLSEKTAQWVDLQNDLTFGYLKKINYREKIKQRLTKLLDYERISAPFEEGKYRYFYKNDGLQNQSVLYRIGLDDGETEIFLNPNTFSKNGTVALSTVSFTKDGSSCAYSISIGGSDWRKIIVIDTETKEVIEDTINDVKFSGISWKGNEGFYYSSYDKPKQGKSKLSEKTALHKLYYHKKGTPQSKDKLIFGGSGDPYRYVYGYLTEDERYLALNVSNRTSGNRLFIQDLKKKEKILPIDTNKVTDEYVLYSKEDTLWIFTNEDAPNNKLIKTTIDGLDKSNWEDVIPETENVLSVGMCGGHIFASYLVDAKTQVKHFDLNGELIREVELPAIGTAKGFEGKEKEKKLYYTFTSFTYPSTVYTYDLNTGKSKIYQQPKVDFNSEDYETKQIFYSGKDGTKIPMFIVHKKGIELNGKNPTYLYAYGGFNISLTPSFSTQRILWLENGGVFAMPNLRGGGEYGEKWHKAGTKMNKQNVFDDFIAAAEWLIQNKYTASDYLAIAGGSNGGLLVGATMTQRPDLMKVVLPSVGVLDMLRYHRFTSGAGWASDYGTSEESEEMFRYLYKYSPVHAVKKGTKYPATLITTADHDDRVVPAHSFKFSATLQAAHQGKNPVLIRIEKDAGHGAGKPISKRIELMTDIYAFTWYNMGIIPPLAEKDR